jgi:hypothetical protein
VINNYYGSDSNASDQGADFSGSGTDDLADNDFDQDTGFDGGDDSFS